ncbi:MAG: non-homologous end-joining DNA ligase [Myxococcales bacterium]|jgi:bifunctional non-homologous end joining protein LigD
MATRQFGPYSVETSRETKILFPKSSITKGDLIDYYERISDQLLPHLSDRPLVLQRFPDGIAEQGFYQKQIGDYFPDWIAKVTVEVASSGSDQDLVVCNNTATLVYLANQACITLHPWLSRTDRLDHPDQLVVDLDPPSDDFEDARAAALELRELLEKLELPSFPKLTGSRGIHVHIPLDRSDDFDEVRGIARSMMSVLADRHPDTLTTEQRKDQRGKRLFLDVGRNAYAQTAVAPYVVRAREGAPVAAPVTWSELEKKGMDSRSFSIENLFRRLGQIEDPWKGWRRHACSLQKAKKRLADLGSGSTNS